MSDFTGLPRMYPQEHRGHPLPVELVASIAERRGRGHTFTQIARELDLAIDTVRKYAPPTERLASVKGQTHGIDRILPGSAVYAAWFKAMNPITDRDHAPTGSGDHDR